MVASTTVCVTESCVKKGRSLASSRKDYAGTLYTRGEGPVPIRIVTLHCRGAHLVRFMYYISI